MNTARIVVLMVALSAGGVAAYLASGRRQQAAAGRKPAAQLQTVDVLVAKSDIGLGQTVKPEDLQWQTWPAATASTASSAAPTWPDATRQVAGSIARAPFIAGEPIREQKLVKANGTGFMAAILPAGMRADLDRNLAGDRRRRLHPAERPRRRHSVEAREEPGQSGAPDVVISEIILANVRVLAIDQAPKEKDGQNTVVGKTVTLELKPEQAETLARARQSGTLSLALRSIADVNMVENRTDDQALKRGESISVVRYGVPGSTTTQK